MQAFWSAFIVIVTALVVFQAASLIREKIAGASPESRLGGSAQNYRYVKLLRIAGGVGVFTVWLALIYVATSEGGITQPQHGLRGLLYPLLYTSFWLNVMRKEDWQPLRSHWAGLKNQVLVQTVLLATMFVAASASVADLYFAAPLGSRAMRTIVQLGAADGMSLLG